MAESNLEKSRSKSSVLYLEVEGAQRELVDALDVVTAKEECFNHKQAAFEASLAETGFWRAVLRDNGISECLTLSTSNWNTEISTFLSGSSNSFEVPNQG